MSAVNVHVQPNKIYKDPQSLSIEEWGVRDNLRKKKLYINYKVFTNVQSCINV